jgi:hypothetical protein
MRLGECVNMCCCRPVFVYDMHWDSFYRLASLATASTGLLAGKFYRLASLAVQQLAVIPSAERPAGCQSEALRHLRVHMQGRLCEGV